jgi:hypothetical protein
MQWAVELVLDYRLVAKAFFLPRYDTPAAKKLALRAVAALLLASLALQLAWQVAPYLRMLPLSLPSWGWRKAQLGRGGAGEQQQEQQPGAWEPATSPAAPAPRTRAGRAEVTAERLRAAGEAGGGGGAGTGAGSEPGGGGDGIGGGGDLAGGGGGGGGHRGPSCAWGPYGAGPGLQEAGCGEPGAWDPTLPDGSEEVLASEGGFSSAGQQEQRQERRSWRAFLTGWLRWPSSWYALLWDPKVWVTAGIVVYINPGVLTLAMTLVVTPVGTALGIAISVFGLAWALLAKGVTSAWRGVVKPGWVFILLCLFKAGELTDRAGKWASAAIVGRVLGGPRASARRQGQQAAGADGGRGQAGGSGSGGLKKQGRRGAKAGRGPQDQGQGQGQGLRWWGRQDSAFTSSLGPDGSGAADEAAASRGAGPSRTSSSSISGDVGAERAAAPPPAPAAAPAPVAAPALAPAAAAAGRQRQRRDQAPAARPAEPQPARAPSAQELSDVAEEEEEEEEPEEQQQQVQGQQQEQQQQQQEQLRRASSDAAAALDDAPAARQQAARPWLLARLLRGLAGLAGFLLLLPFRIAARLPYLALLLLDGALALVTLPLNSTRRLVQRAKGGRAGARSPACRQRAARTRSAADWAGSLHATALARAQLLTPRRPALPRRRLALAPVAARRLGVQPPGAAAVRRRPALRPAGRRGGRRRQRRRPGPSRQEEEPRRPRRRQRRRRSRSGRRRRAAAGRRRAGGGRRAGGAQAGAGAGGAALARVGQLQARRGAALCQAADGHHREVPGGGDVRHLPGQAQGGGADARQQRAPLHLPRVRRHAGPQRRLPYVPEADRPLRGDLQLTGDGGAGAGAAAGSAWHA